MRISKVRTKDSTHQRGIIVGERGEVPNEVVHVASEDSAIIVTVVCEIMVSPLVVIGVLVMSMVGVAVVLMLCKT